MKRLVSKGIEVETVHKDAMAARHTVRVSIPAYSAVPDMDELAEVFATLRGNEPRSIAQAKEVVLSIASHEAPAPLSTEEFYATALRLILQIEDIVAKVPDAQRLTVLEALDWAFAAGVAVTTGGLRSQHLVGLERNAGSLGRSSDGGKNRWPDEHRVETKALIEFIETKIAAGMTPSQGASLAFKRSRRDGGPLGTSAKNNRERYRYYIGKRASEETCREVT